MKKTKICALALSTCLALGIFAGCDDTKNTTASSSSEATSSETYDSIVFTDPDREPVVDTDGDPEGPVVVSIPSANSMPDSATNFAITTPMS